MSQDSDARLSWSRTTVVMAVVFAFGGGCGGNQTVSDLASDQSLSDAQSDAPSDAGADAGDAVLPDVLADAATDLDGAAGDLDIPSIPSCRYSQMGPVGSVVALCHEGDSPVMPFPSDHFTRPATPPSSGSRLWVGLGRNQLTDDALSFLMSASQMSDLLARRDGFAVLTPILVPFSAPLAPSMASDDPARSLSDTAPVLLVRLDSDGSCQQRIPVTTQLYDGQGPDKNLTILVARPHVPLLPATRYGLVVTKAVQDANGLPISADSQFSLPTELSCLGHGPQSLCPADVVAASLFSTSATAQGLDGIRTWLDSSDAPLPAVQMDEPVDPATLSVWPDTVTEFPASSVVIRGSFVAPDLRNAAGDVPHAAGDPVQMSGTIQVPFILLLPAQTVPGPWRLAVLAHGKNGSKERLAYLAQRFGEAGIALAAIDATGHGELEAYGNFDTYDIPVLRGSYLQSQVDMLVFFRVLQQIGTSDFLPAGNPDGAPELDLSSGIGYVGESMGGILGGAVCALEPAVTSVVLNVAGGGLAQLLLSYVSALIPSGKELTVLALETLVEPLLEPADPLAFATRMLAPGSGRSLLLQAVVDDDTVPNANTNLLALYLGLNQVCPCAIDVPQLPQVTAPASVNALHYFANASHGFLLKNSSNPQASDAARVQASHFLTTSLKSGQGEVLVP